MITIIETIPNKLPGITSLIVKFDFNQEVLDIIKSIQPSYYDKKSYTWELPTSELSNLINTFCYLDDIELNLYHCNDVISEPKLEVEYKANLYEHQIEGIKYGLTHDKWMLLDDPGLGKTMQLIYLAEELHKQRGLEHCLIICGVNSLKTNWKNEIQKYSNLNCRIIGEHVTSTGNVTYKSIKERSEELQNEINEFFIITNIESFRDEAMQKAFAKSVNKINMIALDEAHKIKSNKTLQAQALLELEAQYKVAATGTVIVNSALDSFMPLSWIGKNNSTLTRFKQYYTVLGGESGFQVIGFKNMDILQEQISLCSLRRKKDILKDLPEKTIIEEYVEMSPEHQKLYNSLVKGVKEDVDKIKLHLDQKGQHTNLLSLVNRLRQATSCPSVLTTKPVLSSKIERAQDLAEQLISQNEKVVIFCSYKDSVSELEELLREYNPIILTGDTPAGDIQRLSDEFQEDESKKLIIATWQKMGTGFTLNAASYMICVDCAWTPSSQRQTEDRIHRIGSKRPVFIYRLICNNTIDERVANILSKKKALSDYLVDDTIEDDNALASLKSYVQNL